MAQSEGSSTGKKLIQIDISSDTVCPWCFVGKRNLDKAIASSQDQFDFELRWHPFFLNPSAPKEGINKIEFYKNKFGPRSEQIAARMTEVFRGLGLQYNLSGLTGNTLDSHRLIYFAGKQGLDKQHNLVEELCLATSLKERNFLWNLLRKLGSKEQLNSYKIPTMDSMRFFPLLIPYAPFGCQEYMHHVKLSIMLLWVAKQDKVNEEFKKYSAHLSGVPYYVINGKQQLSGGQPPEVFLRAFQAAAV
ncbi:hypothetical protein CK203_085083 [Vitis vinifera]|uniref:DSBA-like thioredoxin domain-containing protein n=1 Tax=Vitis vinifera TaxID=29760 RepID=A0A438DUU2_VITVI|nr:hypothetical protein CK203_085083 [Vitis vinifera]